MFASFVRCGYCLVLVVGHRKVKQVMHLQVASGGRGGGGGGWFDAVIYFVILVYDMGGNL